MGNFAYVENADMDYMYSRVNGNGIAALRMYTRSFLIHECRTTEFFSGYIVNFGKRVRSTSPGMMLMDEELAVLCPSLEEILLNVLADRPESRTKAVAHYVNVSHRAFVVVVSNATCLT
ncbi:hypothetical protein TNCV_439641 [Trichonephila clavipes]|nr:hypothetical protein TNCV_439641 [Trichonephila clavipes]